MNNFQLKIGQISENERSLLEEYLQLVTYSELSEKQVSRIGEILELAESSLILSLIIDEIDNWTYEQICVYQQEQKLIFSPKTKEKWKEQNHIKKTIQHSEDWGLSLGG